MKPNSVKRGIQIGSAGYSVDTLPCGKCIECKRLRRTSWYVRLWNEIRTSQSCEWVCLTYQDNEIEQNLTEHCPVSENGYMTLDTRHLQLFFKRLRKYEEGNIKIKYYVSGEYGSNRHRPHYHAFIFNVLDYRNIIRAWNYGYVWRGVTSEASVMYSLKYQIKNSYDKVGTFEGDDRMPERSWMSKGLGLNFLTPAMVKHYKQNPVALVRINGAGYQLPRYYVNKLFSEKEKRERSAFLVNNYIDGKKIDEEYIRLFPQRVERMYEKFKKIVKKTD